MYKETKEWAALVPELTVSDLPVSLDFYESCGFNVRFRRSNPSFAYIELGAAQIMLQEPHAQDWITGSLKRPFGRGINLQIEVESAQTIADNLHNRNIELFRDLADSWYDTTDGLAEGQREFLVQDPDGYLLRFAQSLGARQRNT